jgi:hypothetical protein
MELVNESGLTVGWTVGFRPDAREMIIVAVKATFDMAGESGEPALSRDRALLVESDQFTGEPGSSATLFESDYAHHKPFCDVLVNGCAYASQGRRMDKVTVGLHIGPIQKRFEVVGDRVWDGSIVGFEPTPPTPFEKLPLLYDRAYGGFDTSTGDQPETKTYLDNPVGIGYYPLSGAGSLVGRPLANTQQIGTTATSREGNYRPMSLGPMGRNFRSRIRFAGTYDDPWLNEQAPFFPRDFDYRYFQCAPQDQQMPYPKGGETVVLENLTPDGVASFRLPTRQVPVLFTRHHAEATQVDAAIDTIVIEPEKRKFSLTWRANQPVRRNCFEIDKVVVGKTMHSYRHDVRAAGKTHYASIEEFIRSKKRGVTR